MEDQNILQLTLPVLEGLEAWKRLRGDLHDKGYMQVFGVTEGQRWHMLAALGVPLFVVCATEGSARAACGELQAYLSHGAALYPAREMSPERDMVRSRERDGQQLQVLMRMLSGDVQAVVTSLDALLQPVPDPRKAQKAVCTLAEGMQLADLPARLAQAGYSRVESVEGSGQFAVRGGLVDVFPMGGDQPVRVEFFDDEVDSLRYFDPLTQRSVGRCRKAVIPPASLLLWDREERHALLEALQKAAADTKRRKLSAEAKRRLLDQLARDSELVANGMTEPGMEAYGPLLPDVHLPGEYMPGAVAVLDEPVRIHERAEALGQQFTLSARTLLEQGRILPAQARPVITYSQALGELLSHGVVGVCSLTRRVPNLSPREIYNFEGRGAAAFHGQLELAAGEIGAFLKQGYRVVLACGGRSKAQRLAQELSEMGVSVQTEAAKLQPGTAAATAAAVSKGYVYPECKLAVFGESELFGAAKKPTHRRHKNTAGQKITTFADISEGDHVVHDVHGVGVYQGIVRMLSDGVYRDYLHIVYAGGDKLYVPTDQMDRVQKFIGGGDKPPTANRLGSGEWNHTKSKVREGVRKLAFDLVKLYAARQSRQGFAFGPDTPWQLEFEDAFPYQETQDQLAAIEDIKRDMEAPRPMDRLLCGDVGYGKTEVAMRAAMKAVMAGKQVAVLVPTTVLAQQHHATMRARFGGIPCTIRELSRFRTAAEQKATLADLEAGKVDIVVGTHRLLANDVHFKDLGLLIIDEEQRFGVGHKDKIKVMKNQVDVLSMSATPIPRTLHMSMVGIRDISTIETPPEDRFPVQTFVCEHNDAMVAEAIQRELAREGQCFYVYNRVESIYRCADRLQQLVPEARIAVAHGQMPERRLEEVMMAFLNGEFDVLVATTIIESGLDIPNANTLIIENADYMGLAQLYQLRGRVGRSNRLAYAYFTYRPEKVLTEVAEKRLAAIREFTQFGAGFKIAMRDLEIRGAGNLLGPEQHGQMAAVGYDMYCRLVEDAVRELRGEEPQQQADTVMELLLPAYLSDSYVSKPAQKVEMYRRIAAVRTREDREDVLEEMIDRYGDPPTEAVNLVNIAYFKAQASRAGVATVLQRPKEWVLRFAPGARVDTGKLLTMLADRTWQATITPGESTGLIFRGEKVMPRIQRFLEELNGVAQ